MRCRHRWKRDLNVARAKNRGGQICDGLPLQIYVKANRIERVEQDGLPVWEVRQGGIVRYFKHDWKARWFYESCVRYYRTKVLGKGS